MNAPDCSIKCLGCGQAVLGAEVINHTADGKPCRQCVERVLDAQPTLITDGMVSAAEARQMAPILQFPAPHSNWDEPEPA